MHNLGKTATAFLLVLFSTSQACASRIRDSFQSFFPDVRDELIGIVANNCSTEFQQYKSEKITLYGHHCVKMFSCVMRATSEYTKSNFGSACVLLGLTPTVLATVGSSTPELAILSSNRPLLTFFIVLGSPAVNALRAFDFSKSVTDFRRFEKGLTTFPRLSESWTRRWICVIVEYTFAILSVANLAHLSYIINRNTICIMSCDNSDMLVELWIGMALITHALGTATLFSRSRPLYRRIRDWRRWLKNEFSPCAAHKEEKIRWNKENVRFIVFSWLTTVFTICHLGFGTIMFSSLYFVGKTLILHASPGDSRLITFQELLTLPTS
jgi:hypothetical protein